MRFLAHVFVPFRSPAMHASVPPNSDVKLSNRAFASDMCDACESMTIVSLRDLFWHPEVHSRAVCAEWLKNHGGDSSISPTMACQLACADMSTRDAEFLRDWVAKNISNSPRVDIAWQCACGKISETTDIFCSLEELKLIPTYEQWRRGRELDELAGRYETIRERVRISRLPLWRRLLYKTGFSCTA